MKKTLRLLTLFLLIFLVVGCQKQTNPKITNIMITDDSVTEFDEGQIDLSLINIKVIKDNKETIIKELKEEYLITDINNLQIGINTIEAKYENFTFYFSITIKKLDDLRFTYQDLGMNYYITSYIGKDENITLPTTYKDKKVIGIDSSAFLNNSTIKTVIIPKGYTYLGEAAFYNCSNLKSIYIPSTIKTLKSYSLNSAHIVIFEETLDKMTIENNNWYDEKNAKIYENINIDSLAIKDEYQYLIEENVTILGYIGNEENVVVPSNFNELPISIIGSNAFYNNLNLKTVELSDQIEILGIGSFKGCENLTNITLSKSLRRIEDNAFGNCYSLEQIEFFNNLEFIGHNAFIQCSSLKNLTIPNSVIKIDSYAFAWCTKLETIYIPNTVINIGEGAVYGCSKLTVNTGYTAKPETWHENWNPNNRKVNWGK